MTGVYDYFKLRYPNEGVSSGFIYKEVNHIKVSEVANNLPFSKEILYDQPEVDNSKSRITGPFTVEAVPSPSTLNFEDINSLSKIDSDNSIFVVEKPTDNQIGEMNY